MAFYKITYRSQLVPRNKFVVEAKDEAQARERFKEGYTNIGGNFANVIKILSIEKAKEGEDIQEFYMKD